MQRGLAQSLLRFVERRELAFAREEGILDPVLGADRAKHLGFEQLDALPGQRAKPDVRRNAILLAALVELRRITLDMRRREREIAFVVDDDPRKHSRQRRRERTYGRAHLVP